MSENFNLLDPAQAIIPPQEKPGSNFIAELWKKIAFHIQADMNPETFDLWLKPLKPLNYEMGKFILQVPSKFYGDWVKQNCQTKIEGALREITNEVCVLEIIV